VTPDVNVLVAASRTDHPHHRPALAWLQEALMATGRGRRFSLMPMVAAGFLRLVTHPKVFLEPTPLAQAQDFLTAIEDTPGVAMMPLGKEWPLFEHLCQQHGLAGNAIPDAWIAAAVLANHDHLVSFDQGFRQLLRPHQLTLLRS
jgi:toxin-antitoxin system PIN domain toxin